LLFSTRLSNVYLYENPAAEARIYKPMVVTMKGQIGDIVLVLKTIDVAFTWTPGFKELLGELL